MAHQHIYDHRGDVVRTLHLEDPTDPLSEFTTVMEQDVDPALDYARAMQDVQQNGAMRLVAVMPQVEYERLVREGRFNDPDEIARWANDSTNSRLRVWGGRI